MTWLDLVSKNLLRRPVRTALTAAGVAIGVGLIVALLSISAGVKRTAGDLIHVGRADFGLFQAGAADLTRSVLPASLAEKIANEPGVARVASIYLFVGRVEGRGSSLVFGYVPTEFPARRLVITSGRRPDGDEALLGDKEAKILKLRPRQRVHVGGRSFRIAGVYHSGNRFVDIGTVLPLSAVQGLAQRPGEVTTFAVEVDLGSRPATVAKRLERDFPGLAAVSEPGQAVKIDASSRLIVNAGWIFSLIALIVGGISVTNTMAMSVFERMREIGILRAIGWRTRLVAGLIISEAIGICLLALGLGLLLGLAAAKLFVSRGQLSSIVEPNFTAEVFAWGLAYALGVGLIGALYPAWRAVRLIPIEALRRE